MDGAPRFARVFWRSATRPLRKQPAAIYWGSGNRLFAGSAKSGVEEALTAKDIVASFCESSRAERAGFLGGTQAGGSREIFFLDRRPALAGSSIFRIAGGSRSEGVHLRR